MIAARRNLTSYKEVLRSTALREGLDLTGILLGGSLAASKQNATENKRIPRHSER